jgi:hypothetical protein
MHYNALPDYLVEVQGQVIPFEKKSGAMQFNLFAADRNALFGLFLKFLLPVYSFST